MQQLEWNKSLAGIRIAAHTIQPSATDLITELTDKVRLHISDSMESLEDYLLNQSIITLPDVLLIEVSDNMEDSFAFVERIKQNQLLKGLIVIILAEKRTPELLKNAQRLKVNDCYISPYPINDIIERFVFLVKFNLIKPSIVELSDEDVLPTKIPRPKRAFDIFFSLLILACFMPMFIVVAILIRLESKGPIIYKSKRVGTGYKIFDFYKFRSMRPDADKNLKNLATNLNQYTGSAQKSTFIKLKNDPRITRVGAFIRKTSIDELPQLFNVLKGDMSIVGNRPLPLYEAEMLTCNEWSWRFLAPAGLTGLWQISRRGREEMSERERKKLDNFYAKKYSVWFDLKILLKTIPAAIQKENV